MERIFNANYCAWFALRRKPGLSIAPGSREEKTWELQQSKAQTSADVLGEEGFAQSLTATDLEYLFSENGATLPAP